MGYLIKNYLFYCLLFGSSLAFPGLYTLENGINIILEERPSKFIALYAFVKAGSVYEEKWMGSGISHLTEHMLFKGTKKRPPGKIAKEIEKEGGRIDAETGFDKTVYKIVIPSPSLYVAVDILYDALFFPSFPEEELIKEKDVILREIETRDDDAEAYLLRALFNTAYKTHPCRHPIIGYKELFNKLTRNDVIAYHKKRYIPENITIVACGGFDETELLNKLKRVFSGIPRGEAAPVSLPDEPKQMSKRRFYEEKNLSLAYLNIGFHIPPISHPDIYSLDILSVILGKGLNSRLNKALKENKGIVFSISSWSYTPTFPGLFGISAKMPEKFIEAVEEEILSEIEKIKKDGVSQKEFSLACKKVIADWYEGKENIEKIAYDLGLSFLATGDPYFSEFYIKKIKEIKPSKLKDVARLYLNEENMSVCILAPIGTKKEEEKIVVKKREIKRCILPNGLVALISPSNTQGLVSIHAIFKGGRLFEREGKEGISNLVASLLLKGTKNKSSEEIMKELDSLGGSISSYGGRNSLGISMSVLPEDVDKGLRILSEILTEPSFPEDEIKKEKRNAILSIYGRSDDLFLLSMDTLLSTLYKIHPYRIPEVGKKESIENISRRDILLFYEERIMPNNMVLVVFGDIETKKVEGFIKKYFLKWKKRVFYKPHPWIEPQLESERITWKQNKRFKSASLMIGFLGVRITDEERYTFELISSLLSRQGGRLFEALREEEGLLYQINCFNIFGLDPGCFVIYSQTSKENLNIVEEKIKREINRLSREEIPIDELKEVKAYLIGEKEKRQEDNASYGFEAGLCELYGLGYEELERYKENLQKITPDTIKRIAQKYLSFERKAKVIISP